MFILRLVFVLCLIAGWHVPAAADGSGDIEVKTSRPFGELGGALRAAGNGPAVLIVPGSGPTNRDGNNPGPLQTNTYLLLAEGLAARGVSSVRIDKRGMFASASEGVDPNAVKVADYAADIRAWTAAMSDKMGLRCLWVAGHSEGGLMALAAAQGAPATICGLILLAAPGRPLGQILREQLAANPANALILKNANRAIDALERGDYPDLPWHEFTLKKLFRPDVQDFLIDLFAQEPAALIADIQMPVLIVQGGRDIQITLDDATALSEAQPNAELAIFLNANHVLKTVNDDSRAANAATYSDPDLPLANGIVERIADFIAAHDPK